MPEARVLGSNTTGYEGNTNLSQTKHGLYEPKEYKSNINFNSIKAPYTTKPYDINDAKIYETKVNDPFKQKVHTYDKVTEYDHYYTYGMPEYKPKPKKKPEKPPTPREPTPRKPTPIPLPVKQEDSLFPEGYRRSTVGMVKRTLKLSRDNKVTPLLSPLPGW